MSKKLISVLMAMLLFFSLAMPAFAADEGEVFGDITAINIVKERLWLDSDETEYDVSIDEKYFIVDVLNNGITYHFRITQTDGALVLTNFEVGEKRDFSTLIGLINALFVFIGSLF